MADHNGMGDAGYAENDFALAVERAAAEGSLASLGDRLGIDVDYLSWLALNLSAEVIGPVPGEHAQLVANGSEAFTAGFLIGVLLPGEPGADPDLGTALPHAIEDVRERGRHAIIADHCDLAAVASLENVYSSAL